MDESHIPKSFVGEHREGSSSWRCSPQVVQASQSPWNARHSFVSTQRSHFNQEEISNTAFGLQTYTGEQEQEGRQHRHDQHNYNQHADGASACLESARSSNSKDLRNSEGEIYQGDCAFPTDIGDIQVYDQYYPASLHSNGYSDFPSLGHATGIRRSRSEVNPVLIAKGYIYDSSYTESKQHVELYQPVKAEEPSPYHVPPPLYNHHAVPHNRGMQAYDPQGQFADPGPNPYSNNPYAVESWKSPGQEILHPFPGSQVGHVSTPFRNDPSAHYHSRRLDSSNDKRIQIEEQLQQNSLPPIHNSRFGSTILQQNSASHTQSPAMLNPRDSRMMGGSYRQLDGPISGAFCFICQIPFLKAASLKRHDRESHGLQEGVQCGYCNKWVNTHGLNRHVQDVHLGRKRFACDVDGCTAIFTYENRLKVHMRQGVHGDLNLLQQEDRNVHTHSDVMDSGDDRERLRDAFFDAMEDVGNSSPGYDISSGFDEIGTAYPMNELRDHVQPTNYNGRSYELPFLENSNPAATPKLQLSASQSWGSLRTNVESTFGTAHSSMNALYDNLGYYRIDSRRNNMDMSNQWSHGHQQFEQLAENGSGFIPQPANFFSPSPQAAQAAEGFGLGSTITGKTRYQPIQTAFTGRPYSSDSSAETHGSVFPKMSQSQALSSQQNPSQSEAESPELFQPSVPHGVSSENSVRVMCTWPNCEKTYVHRKGMDRHIKTFHMGQRPWVCQECGKTYQESSALKKHVFKLQHRDGRYRR
ncbi:uncharacterized protein RSE6_10581 [Rhynchosporium secalis]|uniref:C2H2-type domain-containing protein n=1 Tax=Rhynchosporium secalis TaxID=38038 RepID=A0A1E1MKU0_RHYSE|nr:uncharacterized protein RSE6_10581 [Rhynchosporium secalis]